MKREDPLPTQSFPTPLRGTDFLHSESLVLYQQIAEMTYGSLSYFSWSSSIQLLTIADSD